MEGAIPLIEQEVRICPVDGTEFFPTRSDATYCSAKCRAAAARDRQKKRTTQQLQAKQMRVQVFIKALEKHDKHDFAEIVESLLEKHGVDPAFDAAEKLAWIVGVRF